MAIRIKTIGNVSKMRATASAVDDDTGFHTRDEWEALLEADAPSLEGIAARAYGAPPKAEEIDVDRIYARFNKRTKKK